jgi:hypothetical protein
VQHTLPKCIDTNSYYITPICIYLYIIINVLNEAEDAYSLEKELNPSLWRCVLHIFFFVGLYLLKNNMMGTYIVDGLSPLFFMILMVRFMVFNATLNNISQYFTI